MKEIYDNKKSWRLFMINISLIILIFMSGIFLGFVSRTNRIIETQMLTTARTHFKSIVLTRRWNASHGGVYVEKKPGVVSNPYLETPDLTTVDGRILTKKNPALMTREISELGKVSGDLIYHITSLNPLNPANAPDAFEKTALRDFENGTLEVFQTFFDQSQRQFRYMAPLTVEESCLACHAKQGYRIGDVRGGISISLDASWIDADMKKNRIFVALGSALTGALLLCSIFFMVSRQARKLNLAYDTIKKMAITDHLTGLYNRRQFHTNLAREIDRAKRSSRPICLLMADIDHFKKVNDTHGHQTGDRVLREVARTIQTLSRDYDTPARYGGEEFAVILPDTDTQGGMACAEKLRTKIQELIFRTETGPFFHVTVSIGVAALEQIDLDTAQEAIALVKLSDSALYEAKISGRNQVCSKASRSSLFVKKTPHG